MNVSHFFHQNVTLTFLAAGVLECHIFLLEYIFSEYFKLVVPSSEKMMSTGFEVKLFFL